jgi:hypothetical protein
MDTLLGGGVPDLMDIDGRYAPADSTGQRNTF